MNIIICYSTFSKSGIILRLLHLAPPFLKVDFAPLFQKWIRWILLHFFKKWIGFQSSRLELQT
jgi:hypothetical protein